MCGPCGGVPCSGMQRSGAVQCAVCSVLLEQQPVTSPTPRNRGWQAHSHETGAFAFVAVAAVVGAASAQLSSLQRSAALCPFVCPLPPRHTPHRRRKHPLNAAADRALMLAAATQRRHHPCDGADTADSDTALTSVALFVVWGVAITFTRAPGTKPL